MKINSFQITQDVCGITMFSVQCKSIRFRYTMVSWITQDVCRLAWVLVFGGGAKKLKKKVKPLPKLIFLRKKLIGGGA